jgi:hypothetical protein
MRYAKAKLFLPASVAPAKCHKKSEVEATGAGRTFCRAPHFLLGDPAKLVHEVAVERAFTAVYMTTHHNSHVGFGIRSSSSSIFKGHLSHAIDSALSIENVELVSSSSNGSFLARKFGACGARRGLASKRFNLGTACEIMSILTISTIPFSVPTFAFNFRATLWPYLGRRCTSGLLLLLLRLAHERSLLLLGRGWRSLLLDTRDELNSSVGISWREVSANADTIMKRALVTLAAEPGGQANNCQRLAVEKEGVGGLIQCVFDCSIIAGDVQRSEGSGCGEDAKI